MCSSNTISTRIERQFTSFEFSGYHRGLNLIARRLTPIFASVLLTISFSVSAIARALPQQQPTDETARGISLQQQGQGDEAVTALRAVVKRNKNDLRAWHYLGLALEQKGDAKEARKAHEKAATLGEQVLSDQLDDASNSGEVSKRLAPLGEQLVEAANSAQKYLTLAPVRSGKKLHEWQIRADYLRVFSEIANAPPGTRLLMSSKEVSVKARILSKPEPQYSPEARSKQTTGTVLLRAILAANGQVVGIRVLSGLPNGLTEQAIYAARRIKFVPALKDGQPVSTFVQLEYNFNLY
jgi:TonB family protein